MFKWFTNVLNALNFVESTPIQPIESIKLEVTNLKTRKLLKGKLGGYSDDGNRVKVGTRWYPSDQIDIKMQKEYDSATWVGH